MKHLLLLANLGLLALVLLAAVALRGHNPESRHPQLDPVEADTRSSEDADARPPAPDMRPVALRKGDKDVLWEKTLFTPDRSEIVDETQSEDDDQEETERSSKYGDMELIGIGKINKRQAAIILVRERRRRGGGQEPTGGGKKNVYRVDDPIQDTGYTLARIDKAEVEIKRNNESRILALEYGDASKQRRAAAAANDRQQRQVTQQQGAQDDDTPKPPPPPPPPPAPAARSNNGNDDAQHRNQEQQDRRERIRRALEARRKLLEKRREAQNNNN